MLQLYPALPRFSVGDFTQGVRGVRAGLPPFAFRTQIANGCVSRPWHKLLKGNTGHCPLPCRKRRPKAPPARGTARRRAARLEDNTRQARVLSSAAGIASEAVLALWISVSSLSRTQDSCSSFSDRKNYHSLDKNYPSNRADSKHE